MRVQLQDGKVFDVRWKRVRDRDIEGEKLVDTFCYISKVIPEIEVRGKYEEVSSGEALLGNKDVKEFKKAKGRKISLARALKHRFSKDARRIFWNEYKKNCKI